MFWKRCISYGLLGGLREQRDGGQLDLVVLRTAFDTDEAYQQWRELQLLLQNRVSSLSDPNPAFSNLGRVPPVRPKLLRFQTLLRAT